MRPTFTSLFASLVLSVYACGGDDEPLPPRDAGADAGAEGDASVEGGMADAGEDDAAMDARPERDAGMTVCGNEEVEGDEVCDDGNTMDGDGCTADCSSAEICGNGTLDSHVGESCDDGNTVNGDGCSADCLSDETCGNGIVDIGVGEVCDDGNTTDGDGCSADCSMGPVCGDGEANGGEACDDGNTTGGDGCSADCSSDETCGNGTVDSLAGEMCDDGNTTAGDGCSDSCSVEVCGNGVVDVGEDCDDGNDISGDGCEGDCTFTCAADTDCDDGMPCNGSETCNTTTHLCAAGSPLADATDCGGGMVCRGGACVAPVCGNGITEGTETCDDGNATNGDGCDNDCTLSCTTDTECDDGQVCTGDETCDTTSNRCTNPADLTDGTACGSDLVCRTGACVSVVCGDGRTEGSEQCDDGNATNGDGCDNDCTLSCTSDSECDDGQVCTGDETCDTTVNRCTNPADLADGTACGSDLVCRGGACVGVVCGDGRTEGSETCDDGNAVNGDGCDNDCTFSCTTDAECDDGQACTGDETCDTTIHTCTDPPDLTDGTPCGVGLVCRGGACTTVVCGNGLMEPGEDCDDGNAVNADGCDNDCTYSCTADADCSDGLVCNGSETCNTTTHVCAAGTLASDGTVCDRDMMAATRDICLSGTCVVSACGDGFVDSARGEDCEDGNATNGDGCDNDCTFSCTADADCNDGLVCDGTETCDTTAHVCLGGAPPADGTVCDRDMMAGTRDICLSGTCVASACGDGFVDTGRGEECEDGNATEGDGCDSDCTFSCTGDADCDDGLVCDGAEMCDTTTNTCVGGTPPADGTGCDGDMMAGTRDICLSGTCVASTCGDGFVDTGRGEECEDGNATDDDGCDNDCTFSCTADADCDDARICNGAETCNTTTHVCAGGSPPPDGTLCDRDMNASTRDICRTGTCSLSECGDGYVDAGRGETCDDGNLVAGDGCEPDCTVTGAPPPTAFRIDEMDLMDPHFFVSVFGCRDVTENPFLGFSVNGALNDEIDAYNLNYVDVFRPLDIAAASTPMDLVIGATCSMGPSRDTCSVGMGSVTSTTANNRPLGMTCYTADPSTLTAMYTPEINVVTGPCFVTDPRDIVVDINGIAVPLQGARMAATYSGGSPPTTLVSGVISGFLTEADAQMIILPDTLPLVGGDTLYEHLAAGRASGSSCASHDDRDTRSGVVGFWFYLNFHASLADWTSP